MSLCVQLLLCFKPDFFQSLKLWPRAGPLGFFYRNGSAELGRIGGERVGAGLGVRLISCAERG